MYVPLLGNKVVGYPQKYPAKRVIVDRYLSHIATYYEYLKYIPS